MTLEDTIVARLDALVAAVAELHADVKRLQNAPQEPPEPILETPAVFRCMWPDCGIGVSADQGVRSREWSDKILCPDHEAKLRTIRANKQAAA